MINLGISLNSFNSSDKKNSSNEKMSLDSEMVAKKLNPEEYDFPLPENLEHSIFIEIDSLLTDESKKKNS